MKQMIAGLPVEVFSRAGVDADAPIVLLHSFGEEGARVWEACRALDAPPFRLAAVEVEDWAERLSPWPSKKVYRGGDDFGSGADTHLEVLESDVLPVLRAGSDAPCYIAGYSFAGLFALYALYRSRAFDGAVSASGSLWFPGFVEYARSHEPARRPERVYLSLGDREERTRHPVMGAVGERTRAMYDLLSGAGVPCVLEMNPGNHFRDADLRLAKGIRWILQGRDG